MLALGTAVLQSQQQQQQQQASPQPHHVTAAYASYARTLHGNARHSHHHHSSSNNSNSSSDDSSTHGAEHAAYDRCSDVSETATVTPSRMRPHAPPDTPASHTAFRRRSGSQTVWQQHDDDDEHAHTTYSSDAVGDATASLHASRVCSGSSSSSSRCGNDVSRAQPRASRATLRGGGSLWLRLDAWLTPLQQRRHRGLPHRRAQAKLLELTSYWLALPETQARVDALIHGALAEAEAAAAAAVDVHTSSSCTSAVRVAQTAQDDTPRSTATTLDKDNNNDTHVANGYSNGDDEVANVNVNGHADSTAAAATKTVATAAAADSSNDDEACHADHDEAVPATTCNTRESSSASAGGGGGGSSGGESNSEGGDSNSSATNPSTAMAAAATSASETAVAAPDLVDALVVVHDSGDVPDKLTGTASSSSASSSLSLLCTHASSSSPPPPPSVSRSAALASASMATTTSSSSQRTQSTDTSPVATASVTALATTTTTTTRATATAAAATATSMHSRRGCSYDDIPRFYFPLGKPTTRSRVLTGPVHTRSGNPHLVLPEGATVATSGAAVYDAGERNDTVARAATSTAAATAAAALAANEHACSLDTSRSNSNNNSATSTSAPATPAATAATTTTLPMSTLRCVDDRHVMHYVQKEYARHTVFAKMQKHCSQQRKCSVSAASGGGGGHGVRVLSHGRARSAASLAKLETSYRTHLVQCLQRLCTQTFGVPRYFAHLLVDILQTHAAEQQQQQQQQQQQATAASATAGGSGGSVVAVVTAQHVYELYEAHLKSKDSLRRTFDLLILSSCVANKQSTPHDAHATHDRRSSSSGGGSSNNYGLGSASADKPVSNGSDADASRGASSKPPATQHRHNSSNGGSSSNSSSSTLVTAASPLRPFLVPSDFAAYLHALVQHHPGLAFLKQTPTFQERYVETVIYRIFYDLDRLDRGSIRFTEFALSPLLDAMRQVDACDDINAVLRYFSYEHFYVLYCKFWELDTDRDMLLLPADLLRYAPDDAMNPLLVQRVFAGVGRPVRCATPGCIGYEDFVYFCLSEEDKSTPRAIRYWFNVLDLDADGVLSLHELQTFYDATRGIMLRYLASDAVATFAEVLRQVYDMMRTPAYRGLTLGDLLAARESACVVLNMLTNVVRFWQYEQRDPFVSHQERLLNAPEQTPWDRFARAEYDRMAQEAEE